MIFRKNFPAESMNFLNISHGENTEAQKGHRAAPDFSILAAWRHQGKVASKIESYQKMKWYRENQEAAGNQATAEKPGGFGKAKGGGGTLRGPPSAFTEREMRYFKGLRRQGAVPPRGCAAKGFYRLRGALRRGGIRPGASYRPPERLRPERPRSSGSATDPWRLRQRCWGCRCRDCRYCRRCWRWDRRRRRRYTCRPCSCGRRRG